MTLLILTAILFGILRGIKEGMVMVGFRDAMYRSRDPYFEVGLKAHYWFRYYHAIDVLVYAVYTAQVWLYLNDFPGFIASTGLLFLLWECTELGYNYARHRMPFIPYEHVNWGDIVSFILTGRKVYVWHLMRYAIGVTLLSI